MREALVQYSFYKKVEQLQKPPRVQVLLSVCLAHCSLLGNCNLPFQFAPRSSVSTPNSSLVKTSLQSTAPPIQATTQYDELSGLRSQLLITVDDPIA